jgi:hypothetical protein
MPKLWRDRLERRLQSVALHQPILLGQRDVMQVATVAALHALTLARLPLHRSPLDRCVTCRESAAHAVSN